MLPLSTYINMDKYNYILWFLDLKHTSIVDVIFYVQYVLYALGYIIILFYT